MARLIAPLLPAGIHFSDADAVRAFERVWVELIVQFRGETWKSTEEVVARLRQQGYPNLLQG